MAKIMLSLWDSLTATCRIIPIFVLISSIAVSGCATDTDPIDTENGSIFGKVRGTFRNRWWNYYERGLSFAEGRYYTEAISDLEEAIRQRGKDQRMARTYGMHFIDYFPHRELGIILYETQDLTAAEQELQSSLAHFPSAKAHFYMDRLRVALTEKRGRAIAPPELTLHMAQDDLWTAMDPVIISGVAEDSNYISRITIMGEPLFFEESRKRISFERPLSLPQGEHVIEIQADNLPGRTTKHQLKLHIDRRGPVITIDDIVYDNERLEDGVTLSCVIYDEAGVFELSINGKAIPTEGEKEFAFTRRLVIAGNSLILLAQDRLGNRTSAQIPLPPGANSSNSGKAPRNSGNHLDAAPILLASAQSDDVLLAAIFGSKDNTPPSINIKDFTETQTVFLDRLYLEGDVSDESKIVELTVNQLSILRREGKRIFFNRLWNLEKGNNHILIEARDEAGNRSTKKISVTRVIPRALQLEERLSMTVLPFEQKGQVPESSVSFQDSLIDALVNRNRFRIIERDRLDAILQEQNLSSTKLIDRKTALELGRLMAAQSIVTGSIIRTRTGVEIVARLIDTETAEIISTKDVYGEVQDIPALKVLSEGMAIRIHREFPLLDGLIVQKKGNHVFSDLGQDKIKVQRRLIVFREEPIKHPITGKELGSDNVILGHVRVTQVMPDLSKAEILGDDVAAIKPMDRVITE